jgi:hypothetical protein
MLFAELALLFALPRQILSLGIGDAVLQFVFGGAGLNGELQQLVMGVFRSNHPDCHKPRRDTSRSRDTSRIRLRSAAERSRPVIDALIVSYDC